MWPTHYIPHRERIEGLPPPRTYYTTPPYPPEITEDLTASFNCAAGSFGIGSADDFTASMAFVSGVMDDILVGFDGRRDDLESSMSFVSGSLVSTGFVRGYANDELESSMAFVSGTMADILIIYDNWPLQPDPESLESSMSFVSGALT